MDDVGCLAGVLRAAARVLARMALLRALRARWRRRHPGHGSDDHGVSPT